MPYLSESFTVYLYISKRLTAVLYVCLFVFLLVHVVIVFLGVLD